MFWPNYVVISKRRNNPEQAEQPKNNPEQAEQPKNNPEQAGTTQEQAGTTHKRKLIGKYVEISNFSQNIISEIKYRYIFLIHSFFSFSTNMSMPISIIVFSSS